MKHIMRKGFLILLVIVGLASGWFWLHSNKDGKTPASNSSNSGQQAFNKKQHSLDDPKSLWVIANKQRPLQPKNYAPDDLVAPDVPLRLAGSQEEMEVRQVVAGPLKEMFEAAKQDSLNLMVSSAYRSYQYQDNLYNYYVRQQGKQTADTQSARPGHSEHQTGLAVDVEPASRKCEVEACFADTPEGKWVAANAHTYGFIIRYPEGQQSVTGYIYEPWHLRYVGKTLAAELHKQGNPTLESFFDLGAAASY